MIYPQKYDVIVVGGGHAGCEAALAASRMGCSTLLLTMHIDRIAVMSCNPAIGGLAKGQLVKEIDALGGEMGKAIDRAGTQFRTLNTSKGAAVRSSRAQADRESYRLYMKLTLENQKNLFLRQATAKRILTRKEMVYGVETDIGEKFSGKIVILCPGTFLNGLIHIGLIHFPAGRIGEFPSISLSKSLHRLGFKMERFSTETCPRLDGKSIDFSKLNPQYGDEPPPSFSFSTRKITQPQIPCYITYTNPQTHQIIKENLDKSPLYTGVMKGTGVRYCPSIEDKIVRFPDKDRHQIFLEPEGRQTFEFYPNGLFTTLPIDVQIKMLHSIEGLENVVVVRPGYGIEHDYVDPTQLFPTLETKLVKNLYFAGQINGTTGYEEAAAQGIMAGINAALKVKGSPSLILTRSQAYIGVLIDDLVTRGTREPYRMFTSRAEYRLLLREDNADFRLSKIGYSLGLVEKERYKEVLLKKRRVEEELLRLRKIKITPTTSINKILKEWGATPLRGPSTMEGILRRPEISYEKLKSIYKPEEELSLEEAFEVEVEVKYRGYIKRQEKEIKELERMEKIKIPPDFDFSKIPSLSYEVKEKLNKFKPLSLGQAFRISGVTPAAISILMIYLKKFKDNGG
ncbi:MAG: tRNA uridine-5-carboxymethylaminomethyl(34) synthesis enzyme MnmG [Candidatus Aerophobetes bacterium]|nr:tRNA uridine-5-carboxymethylaminomethyl(34) synthesis enzyme MnmG [Candidatus Aerophobetes bacterium]